MRIELKTAYHGCKFGITTGYYPSLYQYRVTLDNGMKIFVNENDIV